MTRNGRRYMIKGFVRDDGATDGTLSVALQKEFSLAIRLEHPNIVHVENIERVWGFGECIVMEYVEGRTLGQWLNTRPSRSARFRVARQLMDAMNYMHQQGVCHRDLKPDNVMITERRQDAKILDMGLGDADDFIVLKEQKGTARYGAPEQQQAGQADSHADIYSLGLLLKALKLPLAYRYEVHRMTAKTAEKRPDMVQVVRHFNNIGRAIRLLPMIMALAIMGGTFALGLSMRDNVRVVRQPAADTVYTVVRDTVYLKNEMPSGTKNAEITAAHADMLYRQAVKDVEELVASRASELIDVGGDVDKTDEYVARQKAEFAEFEAIKVQLYKDLRKAGLKDTQAGNMLNLLEIKHSKLYNDQVVAPILQRQAASQ